MKIAQLAQTLEMFHLACDPKSVVPQYKLITVSPQSITCRSGWAGIDCRTNIGVEGSPFAINCEDFYSIINSLPGEQEVTFKITGNYLEWKCNSTKGKIPIVTAEAVEPLPEFTSDSVLLCDNSVSEGFDFGTISCASSAGLGGMLLEWRDRDLWFLSSDNVSLAAYHMSEANSTPDRVSNVLAPQACGVLSQLCKRPGGKITFSNKGVLFDDRGRFTAFFSWAAPLQHNLLELLQNYTEGEVVVTLPKDRVSSFIKRSQALAAVRQRCFVSLHIHEGNLSLEFDEQSAQHEDDNLVKVMDGVPNASVHLDATKLSKALAECDQVILDHLDRDILLFTDKGKEQFYMVSVRSGNS